MGLPISKTQFLLRILSFLFLPLKRKCSVGSFPCRLDPPFPFMEQPVGFDQIYISVGVEKVKILRRVMLSNGHIGWGVVLSITFYEKLHFLFTEFKKNRLRYFSYFCSVKFKAVFMF